MTTNLEERTIELDIKGVKTKIVQVSGKVTYVLGTSMPMTYHGEIVGHQKLLSVSTGNDLNPQERRFTYKGDFPIEAENWITAGLNLNNEKEYPEAVYLAKWHPHGEGHERVYTRIDYMLGWIPSKSDMKKIVFD
jgi:hypothetical protein